MIDFFQLWILAYKAFKIAKTHKTGGVGYAGYKYHGTPQLCVFVGTGREAWRISQYAIDHFQEVKIDG